MTIRCIIVDDEPLAREGMELLVKEAGFLELKAVCGNALDANKVLAEQTIDLIFLDIQMPRIRGIDFLKTLVNPPLVVITTAYPNFALEGFELNVLDYLVKPITTERFLKSANRAREVLEYRLLQDKGMPKDKGIPEDKYFFIKSNSGYEKVLYEEILFVEASQNYCFIYTTRTKLITLTSMRALEEQLPADKFLRVQKSYIVSVDRIQSLAGNEITIDKFKIPISKAYKDELMKIIDKALIKK
jgi:two-component system, LytTR family, response regulator